LRALTSSATSSSRNQVENRRHRRLAINQNGTRKVVIAMGRPHFTQIFKTKAASVSFIKSRFAKGTELVTDEASSHGTRWTAPST
jgi:hypothetical protein